MPQLPQYQQQQQQLNREMSHIVVVAISSGQRRVHSAAYCCRYANCRNGFHQAWHNTAEQRSWTLAVDHAPQRKPRAVGHDPALRACCAAAELKAAAKEGRSSSAVAPDAPERVTIREAEEALEANAPPLHSNVVFLLYLTEHTFLDEGGAVARLVQKAMDRGISITPVAEQEPCRGGCAFRQFFQQTPQVLQQPPYKLFDTLAVPLYPSVQHRKVSLRHVLRGMGAQPQGGTHGGVLATAAKVICCHLSGSPWCLRRNGGTMDVNVANNEAALEGEAGGDGGEGEDELQV